MMIDINKLASFMINYEGKVAWMYLDIIGLVTIGIGCLIDPVSLAMKLSFINKYTKNSATKDEITNEWSNIKQHKELASQGAAAAEKLTSLIITEDQIMAEFERRALANLQQLRRYFPNIDSWPEPAAFGVMSMGWAMGPNFPNNWPIFSEACRNQDWRAAAENSHMKDLNNPGLVARNNATRDLFLQASREIS